MRRPVVVCAGALVLLTACATGPRPSLGAQVTLGGGPGTSVGDPPTDAVLQRLENVSGHSFTAGYHIVRKLGDKSTDATVVQDGDRLSVTVGDVRFVTTEQRAVTCALTTGQCESGTLDARISDYSLASTFYAPSPARALRVSYTRKSAATVASDQTIGGAEAVCVDVPVGTGSEHYCATALGPAALWDTAAVHVELTSLADASDPRAFEVPS